MQSPAVPHMITASPTFKTPLHELPTSTPNSSLLLPQTNGHKAVIEQSASPYFVRKTNSNCGEAGTSAFGGGFIMASSQEALNQSQDAISNCAGQSNDANTKSAGQSNSANSKCAGQSNSALLNALSNGQHWNGLPLKKPNDVQTMNGHTNGEMVGNGNVQSNHVAGQLNVTPVAKGKLGSVVPNGNMTVENHIGRYLFDYR